MSIHMHDLQVQNKITSKNSIETKLLEAQNVNVSGIIKANNFTLVSEFDTNAIEKLKISYSENGDIHITANGNIFLTDTSISGDCNVEGELSIGINGDVVLTHSNIGTTVPSISGEGAFGHWNINANYAAQAGRAEHLQTPNGNAGNSSSPVYFDDGLPIECKMTNLTLYSSNNDKNILSPPNHSINFNAWYNLPPFPSGNDTCTLLSNIFIQGAQGDTYGFTQSDLPSNPENGQIFFKIDESNENIITANNGKWIPAIPYIYIPNE